MRSSFLFFVLLAGVQATAQQQFVANPHLPPIIRNQMPAIPPPDTRLLAEATTQVNDSNIAWLHDSVTYAYPSAVQPWNNAEGNWRYNFGHAFDKNRSGGYQQSRYIQSYNSNGELSSFEMQILNNQNIWARQYIEVYTYSNNKRAYIETTYGGSPQISRDSFVYNTNGQLTEITTSARANAISPWVSAGKTGYLYGPDGITDKMMYTVTPTAQLLGLSEHYSYANGKVTEITTKRSNGTAMINEQMQLVRYGINGMVDKCWILNWDNAQSPAWDTVASYVPEYDNSNRDTLWTMMDYNTNVLRHIRHVYDANGLIVKASRQWWDPSTSTWQQGFERRFYYGPHNLNISDKKDNTKNLSIYPVPAARYLNIDISMPVKQELMLAIYQMDGRVVRSWNQPAISTSYKEQVDLSSIPAGNYLLQVNSADGKIVKQFTITR